SPRGATTPPRPARRWTIRGAHRREGRATRTRSGPSGSRSAARRGPVAMASTSTWFESVAEAQRRARRRVPSSVYRALVAGGQRGATLADNVAPFGELGFVPRIATGLPPGRDLSTAVLGRPLS